MDRLAMEAHLVITGWEAYEVNWEHAVINKELDVHIDVTLAAHKGAGCLRQGVRGVVVLYEPCPWEHLTDAMVEHAYRISGQGEFDG